MRRVLIFLLFVSLCLGTIPASTYAQPEPPKLPADLLFMSSGYATRIDAETLQAFDLYADTFAPVTYMQPVSWSPSGRYLAVLMTGWEVCILTRAGTVKRCFEDRVSFWDGLRMVGSSYMVTWADDEQSVYFLVDHILLNHKDLRCLVEADINTGQIRRTLYQIELDFQDERPPKIYWTPSLDTLFIDSKAVEDDFSMARGGYPPDQMREATIVHLPDQETFTMPTELPEHGKLSFCFHFSPSGRYLVARAFTATEPPFNNDDMRPSFVVFDLQGTVLYTIDDSRLQDLGVGWADCPSWRSDEEAFYFLAGNYYESWNEAYILKYSLSDDSLTQYAQVLPRVYPAEEGSLEGDLSLPLFVSPDGDYIAYELEGAYNLITDLAVVFPSGEVIRVGKSYKDNMYPIWIPPLQTDQQGN
jgi:hypothetical protein